MISEFLNDIIKRFIDVLLKRSYGAIVITAAFIILITFTVLNNLTSDSSTITTLRTPTFLSITLITVFSTALLIIKQKTRVPRYIAITILLSIAAVEAVVYWQYKTPTFRADIVFDNTVNPSATSIAKLLGILQQPHFQPALLEKRINFGNITNELSFGDAVSKLVPIEETRPRSTHTLLITRRRLSDSKWNNLFYSIRGRIGVVSLYGIDDKDDQLNTPLVERYLSSMITLVTLHIEASNRFRSLLPDRSPISEHGCLHDFSQDRTLLIEKLRQGTNLCPSEAEAITSVFGPVITNEFHAILANAGKVSNAP